MPSSERGLLNEEYAEKIDDLCDRYGVEQDDIEQLYLDQCREIERVMKDETPRKIIRRLAFDKTESTLADANNSPVE